MTDKLVEQIFTSHLLPMEPLKLALPPPRGVREQDWRGCWPPHLGCTCARVACSHGWTFKVALDTYVGLNTGLSHYLCSLRL
eukprot:1265829-Amphidinium_carterae.1